jgi:predicted transcriptional regulator
VGPHPQDVTEAELAVLQVLWSMGLATIREIRDELYPLGEISEYATVQKLLERLEGKSLVRRSRRSIPHTFAAKIDRDELLGRRLTDIANALCEGSMAPILSHLVHGRNLTPKERRELRRLMEEVLDQPKARRAKE